MATTLLIIGLIGLVIAVAVGGINMMRAFGQDGLSQSVWAVHILAGMISALSMIALVAGGVMYLIQYLGK